MAFVESTTYYFDTTPTDPDSRWTNEANTVDGSTGTAATVDGTVVGDVSNYELQFSGNTAPATSPANGGDGKILKVTARYYSTQGAILRDMNVDLQVSSVSVLTTPIPNFGTTPKYSSDTTLLVPSGGWTWAKLNAMTAIAFYADTLATGDTNNASLARIEFTVTYINEAYYDYPMPMGNTNTLGTGTSATHLPIQMSNSIGSGTEATRDTVVTGEAVFLDMYGILSGDNGANSKNISIMKNSSAALTMTFGATGTTASNMFDTTGDYVSFVAGDRVVIRSQNTGTTTTARFLQSSVIRVLAPKSSIYSSSIATVTNGGGTKYIGFKDMASASASSASAEQRVPEAGTVSNVRVGMQNTLSSGSYTVTLYRNGGIAQDTTATNVVVTLDSSNQSVTWADDIDISAGDLMYWEIVPNTVSNARSINVSANWVSDSGITRQFMIGGNTSNIGTSGTRYNVGNGDEGWNTTSTNREALIYAGYFDLFYARLSAAPSSGKSRSFNHRVNGSTSALSFSIADTATNGSDTGTVSVSDLDIFNVETIANSTPTNAYGKYSLVFYTDEPAGGDDYTLATNDISLGLTTDNTTITQTNFVLTAQDIQLGLTEDNTTLTLPTETNTYYFDASDAGPTDPDTAWTDDANAFDGSTSTNAYTLTNGSTSSNYLLGEGTDAPTSGNTITQVRARVYGFKSTTGTINAAIYTDSLGELLGTPTVSSASGAYGSYATLSTPTGGWTWTKVNDLEVKIYGTSNGDGLYVYRVEIEVTSSTSGDDYTLASNDISLGLTTDNTTITQNHVIASIDSQLGLTLDNTSITQNHVLTTQDIELGLTEDSTTITQNHVLSTQDTELGLTIDNTTITQNHVLTTQDTELGLTIDNTTITQDHVLASQDIELGLTLDNTTVAEEGDDHTIVTQDIELGLTLDNTTINQNHIIATQDVELGLIEDNTTITQDHVIAPTDIELGLTTDNTTLSGASTFIPKIRFYG